ncbi:uncharacterized protein PAF06_015390 [Gastrophryne carolinensis]
MVVPRIKRSAARPLDKVDFKYKSAFNTGCGYFYWGCASGNCGSELEQRVSPVDNRTSNPSRWYQCEGQVKRAIHSDKPFKLLEDSCCWVSNVQTEGGWRLYTTVDLGVRSDTKKPNASPVTAIIPYIRIPQNCPTNITFLAHDPDGDLVTCRHANYYRECSLCSSLFPINENRCTLTVSSPQKTGPHIVEMVLEDFPNKNIHLTYNDGTIAYKYRPHQRYTREAPDKSERYWWDYTTEAVSDTSEADVSTTYLVQTAEVTDITEDFLTTKTVVDTTDTQRLTTEVQTTEGNPDSRLTTGVQHTEAVTHLTVAFTTYNQATEAVTDTTEPEERTSQVQTTDTTYASQGKTDLQATEAMTDTTNVDKVTTDVQATETGTYFTEAEKVTTDIHSTKTEISTTEEHKFSTESHLSEAVTYTTEVQLSTTVHHITVTDTTELEERTSQVQTTGALIDTTYVPQGTTDLQATEAMSDTTKVHKVTTDVQATEADFTKAEIFTTDIQSTKTEISTTKEHKVSTEAVAYTTDVQLSTTGHHITLIPSQEESTTEVQTKEAVADTTEPHRISSVGQTTETTVGTSEPHIISTDVHTTKPITDTTLGLWPLTTIYVTDAMVGTTESHKITSMVQTTAAAIDTTKAHQVTTGVQDTSAPVTTKPFSTNVMVTDKVSVATLPGFPAATTVFPAADTSTAVPLPEGTTTGQGTTNHSVTESFTIPGQETTRRDLQTTSIDPKYVTSLSRIPLQFLVEVTSAVPSCTFGDYRPKFLSPTPNHGEKLLAKAKKKFQLHLSAHVVYQTISDFKVSGPAGLYKSLRASSQSGTASMTVEWTPQESNVGEHVPVCFVAETVNGYHSEFRCVIIAVGPSGLDSNLICHENTMTLLITRSEDDDFDDLEFRLNDRQCLVSSNSTHLIASVGYNSCGTETEETEHHIVFKNQITSYDSANIITRQNGVLIPFNCSFPKKSQVMALFRAHKSDYVFSEAGFGNFTYKFQFFTDELFIEVNTQYPLEVTLRDLLYMEIQVSSSVPNVELFVESCKATPHDNSNDPLFYNIIQNGCIRDNTLVVYPGSRTQYRFAMEAFSFIGNFPEVYISCTVILCKVGEPNTRCSRGCISPFAASGRQRQRRSLVSETQQHFISQGPLRMKRETPTTNTDVKNPLSMNRTTLVIALSLMATVALIAASLNIYLKRARATGYQRLATHDC